jgi:uncharacterized phage protein (TIGR02216 family)
MHDHKFPWDNIMHFGMGRLHLPPTEFWRSTLREIAAAAGTSPPPLLRQSLNHLMTIFPDTNNEPHI